MSLYAVIKARRTTALYDVLTVDVRLAGALSRDDDVTYLADHDVRVSRYAADAEVIVMLAAEVSRLELAALALPVVKEEKADGGVIEAMPADSMPVVDGGPEREAEPPVAIESKPVALSRALRAATPDSDLTASIISAARDQGVI